MNKSQNQLREQVILDKKNDIYNHFTKCYNYLIKEKKIDIKQRRSLIKQHRRLINKINLNGKSKYKTLNILIQFCNTPDKDTAIYVLNNTISRTSKPSFSPN